VRGSTAKRLWPRTPGTGRDLSPGHARPLSGAGKDTHREQDLGAGELAATEVGLAATELGSGEANPAARKPRAREIDRAAGLPSLATCFPFGFTAAPSCGWWPTTRGETPAQVGQDSISTSPTRSSMGVPLISRVCGVLKRSPSIHARVVLGMRLRLSVHNVLSSGCTRGCRFRSGRIMLCLPDDIGETPDYADGSKNDIRPPRQSMASAQLRYEVAAKCGRRRQPVKHTHDLSFQAA
jgi:hypothetical protein